MKKCELARGAMIVGKKNNYTILDKIDDTGGQGGIYLVEREDDHKQFAAKYYWIPDSDNRQEITAFSNQKKSITDLFQQGIPTWIQDLQKKNIFITWPLDIFEKEGSFGYVMSYYNLEETANIDKIIAYQLDDQKRWDYQKKCIMCSMLCEAFHFIHSSGYAYKDISNNNIYFQSMPSQLYIIDVDNLAPDLTSIERKSSVMGTAGYIAPEVLKGIRGPNSNSDRWSLFVLMFQIWYYWHPQHGKKMRGVPSGNKDSYQDLPFIFDPYDKSNENDNNIDNGLTEFYWNNSPKILRELFTLAFTEGKDPDKRNSNNQLREAKWIEVYEDIQNNQMTKCSTCNHYTCKGVQVCSWCGNEMLFAIDTMEVYESGKLVKKLSISSDDCRIAPPLISGYLRCMDAFCEITNNTMIKNISGYPWSYSISGNSLMLQSGDVLCVDHTMDFHIINTVSIRLIVDS